MDDHSTTEDAQYRVLWLAVINRAKQDAEAHDLMCDTDSNVPFVVAEARAWLTTDTEDLCEVCEYANVDAEAIIERFREEYGHNT